MQVEHAAENWFIAIFEITIALFVLGNIFRARKGKELFIRRIPGLNAIDEAIGRATEMGRPILLVPGLGGFDVVTLQALNILKYIVRESARFATPIRLAAYSPAIFTMAQEVVQEAYQQAGKPEMYDPESVRFLSDRQFAFAAGVSGLIHRERVAASFLFGYFYAESLIFAETGNMVGAIQIAGTVSTTQVPFLVAACDYTIIGEEFYATSAYLTREPVLLGSLVGQDYTKIIFALLVLFGVGVASVGGPDHPILKLFGQPGGWDTFIDFLRKLFTGG